MSKVPKKRKHTFNGRGARDSDLVTREHDEILTWILKNKANLFDRCGGNQPHKSIVDMLDKQEAKKELKEYEASTVRAEVQYPVKAISASGDTYNSSPVGYLDVVLYLHEHPDERINYTIFRKSKLYMDIKTEVPSFGDVMLAMSCATCSSGMHTFALRSGRLSWLHLHFPLLIKWKSRDSVL